MALAVACSFALAGSAARARADLVHVYGPTGNAAARRCLVVLARPGGCVPADAPTRWSSPDPEVTVTPGEPAGPCARWLEVRAPSERALAAVRVEAPGFAAEAWVPLGAAEPLEVRAERRDGRLIVEAPRADLGPLEIALHVGDEPVRLLADGEPADARPDALVIVVARRGGLSGAAVLPPSEARAEARVWIVPAERAIHSGGEAREAAYLVALDRRGRPSSQLPLRITSERGELRGLRWVAPGLAAIALATTSEAETIDLVVQLGRRREAHELPVERAWPVGGRIDAPAAARVGRPFEVRVEGHGLGGAPLEPGRLRVACGASGWTTAPARCVAEAPGPYVVQLAAIVDGRPVPLAAETLEVARPAPSRARAPEPAPEPEAPVVWVSVYGGARLEPDLYAGAAGARVGVDLTGWLRLGGALEADAAPLHAAGENVGVDALDGARIGWRAALEAEARFGPAPWLAQLRLGGWIGASHARATLDGGLADGDEASLGVRLAIGGSYRTGELELGVDGGAFVAADLGPRAWAPDPRVGGLLEVWGALPIR